MIVAGAALLAFCTAASAQTVPPPDAAKSPSPEDDDRPLDVVLDAKGLHRVGNAYVLIDQPVRELKAQQFRAEAEKLAAKYKPLFDERDRLKEAVGRASRSAQRNQARDDLHDFEQQYKAELDRYKGENDRIMTEMQLLVVETGKHYEILGSDPAVKRAIRAYNRENRPKVVLGPVATPEEYRAVLLRDAVALLKERGMVPEKGRRWVVEQEAHVARLAVRAYHRLDQLQAVRTAVEAGTPSKLAEKRRAVADRLANAPASESRALAAEVEVLDTQLRRLAPGAPGMAASWGERAGHLAEARRAFLDAVTELRRAADAAPEARRKIESDEDVLAAIEELAGKSSARPASGRARHVAEALDYKHALAMLAELEAMIRVERIRLERAAEVKGARLAHVTINDSRVERAAVDPASATTRLPSALAQTLGATPKPGAEGVNVRLPDGQTVRGRVSALRSVSVGPVSVEHVPCVVLPEDAPGPGWPVLGADLLDMIGGEKDAGGLILVIARVVPPAPAQTKKDAVSP